MLRKIWHRGTKLLQLAAVLGLGFLICLPVLLLFFGSLADSMEWTERMRPLLGNTEEYSSWKWIPDYPTLENFKELLFLTPEFLALFWNSVKIAACILAGQLLVGVPSAWCFAVYDFKRKNLLFSVYVILMLPFQVTMLARYLVLNGLGLLDTHASVILPAVFSTFPVFLVYRGFRGIPRELYEVAPVAVSAGNRGGQGREGLCGIGSDPGGVAAGVRDIPGLSGAGDCVVGAEGMSVRSMILCFACTDCSWQQNCVLCTECKEFLTRTSRNQSFATLHKISLLSA